MGELLAPRRERIRFDRRGRRRQRARPRCAFVDAQADRQAGRDAEAPGRELNLQRHDLQRGEAQRPPGPVRDGDPDRFGGPPAGSGGPGRLVGGAARVAGRVRGDRARQQPLGPGRLDPDDLQRPTGREGDPLLARGEVGHSDRPDPPEAGERRLESAVDLGPGNRWQIEGQELLPRRRVGLVVDRRAGGHGQRGRDGRAHTGPAGPRGRRGPGHGGNSRARGGSRSSIPWFSLPAPPVRRRLRPLTPTAPRYRQPGGRPTRNRGAGAEALPQRDRRVPKKRSGGPKAARFRVHTFFLERSGSSLKKAGPRGRSGPALRVDLALDRTVAAGVGICKRAADCPSLHLLNKENAGLLVNLLHENPPCRVPGFPPGGSWCGSRLVPSLSGTSLGRDVIRSCFVYAGSSRLASLSPLATACPSPRTRRKASSFTSPDTWAAP